MSPDTHSINCSYMLAKLSICKSFAANLSGRLSESGHKPPGRQTLEDRYVVRRAEGRFEISDMRLTVLIYTGLFRFRFAHTSDRWRSSDRQEEELGMKIDRD